MQSVYSKGYNCYSHSSLPNLRHRSSTRYSNNSLFFIIHHFQSAVQAAFNDHQTGDNADGDLGFGINMDDLDVNPNDNDNDGLGLDAFNDIFNADPFSRAETSPSGSPRGNQLSQPGSPSSQVPGSDPAFR